MNITSVQNKNFGRIDELIDNNNLQFVGHVQENIDGESINIILMFLREKNLVERINVTGNSIIMKK